MIVQSLLKVLNMRSSYDRNFGYIGMFLINSNLRSQVMHDCVHWHCPIDYCVELSLVDETLWENCSHFTLK